MESKLNQEFRTFDGMDATGLSAEVAQNPDRERFRPPVTRPLSLRQRAFGMEMQFWRLSPTTQHFVDPKPAWQSVHSTLSMVPSSNDLRLPVGMGARLFSWRGRQRRCCVGVSRTGHKSAGNHADRSSLRFLVALFKGSIFVEHDSPSVFGGVRQKTLMRMPLPPTGQTARIAFNGNLRSHATPEAGGGLGALDTHKCYIV